MKIKFLPQNIEVEGSSDKSLLQIATENQLEIRSICKGVPSCAECRVRIKEGDNNILPPNKAELGLIGTSYFIDGRRLSCQVHCFGDVTVDLTEQVERQENQTKKIRGFRSNKQVESKAVNDMMLLNEKEEPKEHQARDGKESGSQDSVETNAQEREPNREQRQPKEQRPQQHNRPQQQNQNQNRQQQNKGQQRPPQQGQGKPQQQGQQQGQKSQQQQQGKGPQAQGNRPPQNAKPQQQRNQQAQQNRNQQNTQKPKK